jgi:hypothetical protein
MRAMFMQEKYGKVDKSKVIDKLETTETQKPSGSVNSNVPPMPSSPLTSTTKQPVDPSPSTPIQNGVPSPDKPEILASPKLNLAAKENSVVKLDSKRIRWQIPPGIPLLCAPSLAQILRMLDISEFNKPFWTMRTSEIIWLMECFAA